MFSFFGEFSQGGHKRERKPSSNCTKDLFFKFCCKRKTVRFTFLNLMSSAIIEDLYTNNLELRTCVPRLPNMINFIFSPHLQLSNGMWMSMHLPVRNNALYQWLSIRLLWSHLNIVCNSDHNSLMERDSYSCTGFVFLPWGWHSWRCEERDHEER